MGFGRQIGRDIESEHEHITTSCETKTWLQGSHYNLLQGCIESRVQSANGGLYQELHDQSHKMKCNSVQNTLGPKLQYNCCNRDKLACSRF